MYQHILVPLDGSSNANEALKAAIDLAKDWHASLLLLHVTDINQFGGYARGLAYTEVIASMRENATELMTRAKELATAAGVTVTTANLEGAPKQQITDVANDAENGIDLIVIGKSGTNAFSRLVVGSTTTYVVQHAHPNVFVINDIAED
ncbi:universal stress protein [Levilactobacillus brevis]|jgi:nucleotide-binding universal stress UspA family protein|uniref:Universal stress protein n=1 Tax=Levilactobacillus suantsaiihabitans TaxID=2487722 RepID=A0A4Z0J8V8_9LACO|nr:MULTISPECIES: universal stress protein [Lactobacillaceae]MCI1631698.1 universal stress protein [Lacticaseibacillus paracasei]KYK03574.1 universal stress protein UspA [Lactiplantibacillus plantarum]KZE02019.1 Universal stress protein family [Lactiplantibacillus plantarum]MCH4123196.1 universal stress protein [Levilactobacillus sp.]MCI1552666.1 universal stress protein [Levilactobacillus sp.]